VKYWSGAGVCAREHGARSGWVLEKVVGLTGFVIIHVFIALFSPAQGERNRTVNTTFTRPVNEMP